MPENNLNLPKTSFSMKANLPTREPEFLKFWEKINLYNKYLRVEFLKFIRAEKKFKSIDQLKKQIKIDLVTAKKAK